MQTIDIVDDAHLPNTVAHRPSYVELPADVDLHDVQCMAMSGCCAWRRWRLLPFRLEEIRICRRHRALPLVFEIVAEFSLNTCIAYI